MTFFVWMCRICVLPFPFDGDEDDDDEEDDNDDDDDDGDDDDDDDDLLCVNMQDLCSAFLLGQANLNLDFQPARS